MSFDKILYQIKTGQFTSIPAWNLIQHPKTLDFKGKTIIFGDHSLSSKDYSRTPLDGQLHNPLIFGIAMSNILNETFIKPTGVFATICQIIFILVLLMIFSARIKPFEFGILAIVSMFL